MNKNQKKENFADNEDNAENKYNAETQDMQNEKCRT